ncbi:MAG: hypothetical protein EPN33_04005 [Acidobacteria bacterium]|nr:MAG: hypothetical protein EPN33_04005 [Acidobacteriota bacterium]
MPRYYHISYILPPTVDPKAVESAINQQSLDWLRYTGNCYVVWTDADASMLAGALMTVPGMSAGNFMVFKMDMRADSFGYLPNWIWEWLQKDRTVNPFESWKLPPPPPFVEQPPQK